MRRGVILVHVLILVAMMGFIASLMLKWTMSRHLAAKKAVEENENRGLLFAAQAKVFSCLGQATNFPSATCMKPFSLDGCLGSKDVGGRLYNYNICTRLTPSVTPWPPCRVLIAVCEAGAASCCNPITSCPSLVCP